MKYYRQACSQNDYNAHPLLHASLHIPAAVRGGNGASRCCSVKNSDINVQQKVVMSRLKTDLEFFWSVSMQTFVALGTDFCENTVGS